MLVSITPVPLKIYIHSCHSFISALALCMTRKAVRHYIQEVKISKLPACKISLHVSGILL